MAIKTKNINEVHDMEWFKKLLWVELNRYDVNGIKIKTVTCTEDNIMNLYNSQFEDKTVYGQVFYYSRG